MEKAHASVGDPFCNVHRRAAPNFYAFLQSFVHRRAPQFLGIFTQFCLSPPPQNEISIGDRITGPPGFFHVRTPNLKFKLLTESLEGVVGEERIRRRQL